MVGPKICLTYSAHNYSSRSGYCILLKSLVFVLHRMSHNSSTRTNPQRWVVRLAKVLNTRPSSADDLQEVAQELRDLCVATREMNVWELRLTVQQTFVNTVQTLLTFEKWMNNNFSDDDRDILYMKWNIQVHIWVTCLNLTSPSNTPVVRPLVEDGLVDQVVTTLTRLHSFCVHENFITKVYKLIP